MGQASGQTSFFTRFCCWRLLAIWIYNFHIFYIFLFHFSAVAVGWLAFEYIMARRRLPNWPYTCRFARQAKAFICACIDVSLHQPVLHQPVSPQHVSHQHVSHQSVSQQYVSSHQSVCTCALCISNTNRPLHQIRKTFCDKINAKYSNLSLHQWRNTFQSCALTLCRSRGGDIWHSAEKI